MRELIAEIINPEVIAQWETFLGRRRSLAILKTLEILFSFTVLVDAFLLWGAYNIYILFSGEPLSYPWGLFSIVIFIHFLIKEATVIMQGLKKGQFQSFILSVNIHPLYNLLYLIFLYDKYDPRGRAFNLQEVSIYKNPSVLSYAWAKEVENLEQFVSSHYPRSQSLVRFIKERAFFPDCGTMDVSFLIFCSLLPKKRELSIDGIKSILLAFPRFYDDDIYRRIPMDALTDGSKIDHLFKKYSEENFKKLFLRRYNANYFFEIVRIVHEKSNPPTTLPVLESLKECYDFIMEDYPRNLFHPRLIEVDDVSVDSFSFKVLRTEREYKLWGTKLHNCIKDQCWNGREDIIGILKDGEFYGACSFVDGRMAQIKLDNNKEFPLEETRMILDVLEKHLR